MCFVSYIILFFYDLYLICLYIVSFLCLHYFPLPSHAIQPITTNITAFPSCSLDEKNVIFNEQDSKVVNQSLAYNFPPITPTWA